MFLNSEVSDSEGRWTNIYRYIYYYSAKIDVPKVCVAKCSGQIDLINIILNNYQLIISSALI